MALSLAACGGSDDVKVDLTPFAQSDIDSAVATANAAAAATAVTVAEAAATAQAEAVAAVDLTTNDAEVIKAALTDADGITYPTVDAAITAAQSQDVSEAVAAAEAAILGDYADRTALIESNDAAVTTAATNAAEATLVAGTGFASVAALKAAYDAASGAPTALNTELTTGTDVVQGFTATDDTVVGTQATLASTDVMVDSNNADNDTVTINSSTADLTGVSPLMAGIENINFNMTSFAEAKVNAVNMSSGTITMNQLQVGGSANATVNNASGVTVVAGTGITGTLTVEIDDLAESTVVNAGNAATVTQTSSGDTAIINVTVNGSAASTSLTADSGNLGVTTINGTATDVTLSATGATMNVVSAYEGTAITGSDITVVGSSAATDVANVTLGGTVALTNTNVATLNLSAFADATVDISATATAFDLGGSNDISLSVLGAEVTGKTITSSGTGAYTVRLTDTSANEDLSKFDNDITVRIDDITSGTSITIDSGATIDYRDAGASDVMDLVSSSASGVTGDSITVLANHGTTAITNGSAAADGSGADVFSTVNVDASLLDSTVTAIVGAGNALTLTGSKTITLAATSTASSATHTGTNAVVYQLDGTADVTIVGSASGTDTIQSTVVAADNLSNNTFSNVNIVQMTAAAADAATTDVQTVVFDSSQVSGSSLVISGTLGDNVNGVDATDGTVIDDKVSIVVDNGTVDLGGLTIDAATVVDVTLDISNVSTLDLNITGTGLKDNLDDSDHAGIIVVDGGAGDDSLKTGAAADTITGGAGADTIRGQDGSDTIILTEATQAVDTVQFDWQTGEMDSITGFAVGTGKDVVEIDVSDIQAVVTELTNLDDGATLVDDTDVVLFASVTLGTAADLDDLTANSNVLVFDGDIANASTLAIAINNGGDTALTIGGASAVLAAGDGYLTLYDNGVSSFLATITSAGGVADNAIGTDLVVTNLIEFTDIADATTFVAANFDLIA